MSHTNYKKLKLPSLGVNDEIATLTEWFFNEADYVKEDDLICSVETTKVTIDIKSDFNGYLIQLAKESSEVKVGDNLALIADSLDNVITIKKNYFKEQKKNNLPSVQITKKAQDLALEHNIDINELGLSDSGIVREKDIQILIGNKSKSSSRNDIQLKGQVNKDFLEKIEKDEEFLTLPSEKKVQLYRKNGAIIQDGVEIGSETLIISDYINLKEGAKISSNCYIKTCSFELGVMSILGKNANVVTRHVRIGDVFFSGNSITIGGGGAFSNRAKLIIGDECLVSSHCLLNTGEGIIIGNRVGLSPYVKLYTHNHWQNELEGYHSNFGPIIIEDNVYVTGDCLVVPNITIGKGSTIFANSTVVSNVKPYSQLSGNPAKVIGKIDNDVRQNKKVSIIRKIVSSMYDEEQTIDINKENVTYLDSINKKTATDAQVIMTFNVEKSYDLSDEKVIFNLQTYEITGKQNSLSDEVRNYLRRRGIKFNPIHWRYSVDEGLYND